MSTRVVLSFLVGLFLLSITEQAHGQAWTRKQGSYYLGLNYRFLSADRFYSADFSRVDIGRYQQHSLGVFGQVGIIDRWLTATVDTELLRRNVLFDQGRVTGVGDSRFGLWTSILQVPIPWTFGVIVGAPTGDSSPSAGSDADPGAENIALLLPTGDGEWDVELRTSAGYSFRGGANWPFTHYTQGSFGVWIRTEGFNEAFTYNLELGTKPKAKGWDRLLLVTRLNGVESTASNQQAQNAQLGLGNGVTYTAFGFDLLVSIIDQFGISVGIDGAFRGRSIMSAPVYKFTLYHSR